MMLPQKQDPVSDEAKEDAGWSLGLPDICDVMVKKELLWRDCKDVTYSLLKDLDQN